MVTGYTYLLSETENREFSLNHNTLKSFREARFLKRAPGTEKQTQTQHGKQK